MTRLGSEQQTVLEPPLASAHQSMSNPRQLVVQGTCHPMQYYLYPNQGEASYRHHCYCPNLTFHCSHGHQESVRTYSSQAFYYRLVDTDWVCERRRSRQAFYCHPDMGWACATTRSMREFCHRPQDSASCPNLVFSHHHHHHPTDLVCDLLLLPILRVYDHHPIDKDWVFVQALLGS